jgi:hypothetical protein
LRLVAQRGLAVIVSEVDESRPARASDLMAHARVLEDFVEHDTVIPMQFGHLAPDDDTVRRDVLEREHDLLARLLEAFEGVVQVTVQVRHDEEPALREVLTRNPGLARLRDDPSRQLQLGQAVTEGLQRLGEEYAAEIEKRLAPEARALSIAEPKGPNHVFEAAFLVGRRDRGTFDEAVAKLGEETADRLVVRYVGPQPPYSFVEAARDGVTPWV